MANRKKPKKENPGPQTDQAQTPDQKDQEQTPDQIQPRDLNAKPEIPDTVEILLELGEGLVVARANIEDLREQDSNAHVMQDQTMLQLSDNIRDRGIMETMPFCAVTEGRIEIISGHHRKRAAMAAGLEKIFFILDVSGLTRDQIRSKQLSHNSLIGIDDPQIVKQIYEQIKDAEAKIQAFIDPKALEIPTPESIPITDIIAAAQDFKTIMFTFLPHQYDNFTKMAEHISKEVDVLGISDIVHFDEFKTTIQRVKEIEEIISVGMLISKMCEVVNAYYDERDSEPMEDIEDDTENSGTGPA